MNEYLEGKKPLTDEASKRDIAKEAMAKLDKALGGALDYKLKAMCIDGAIKSGAGHAYDDEGRDIVKADLIVEAAKKFETYLKGNTNGV